jgi:hypothetical protein
MKESKSLVRIASVKTVPGPGPGAYNPTTQHPIIKRGEPMARDVTKRTQILNYTGSNEAIGPGSYLLKP